MWTQTLDVSVAGVGAGYWLSVQRPTSTAKCKVCALSGATGLMCAVYSVWKCGFLCVPILRDESPGKLSSFPPSLPHLLPHLWEETRSLLTSLLFTLLMSESPCSNLLFGEGELSLGRYTFAESVVSILSLPSFYPLVLSVKEIQNLPASRISTGFCFNHQPLFSLKTSGLVTCKYRESLEPFLVRVSA